MDARPKESIAAVQHVFALLDALAQAGPASTAELAERVGLSQATTRRMLQTLATLGYLQQQGGAWRLTPQLFELGSRALQAPELLDVAKPVMRELAESSGEAVQLGMLADDEIICLHKIDSHHGVGLSMPVGQQVAIQGSAMGRALMAWCAAWAPFASRGELARIRMQGFCEQRASHVYSVAAPIFERGGAPVAGLAIHLPISRFSETAVPKLVAQLQTAAEAISQGLGCTVTPARQPDHAMPFDRPTVELSTIF